MQTGDGLAGFYGQGYGTSAFGPAFTGGMTVQAAQNWTNTAQGTALTFTTTSIDAASPTTRMTLDATGNLGIGTTTVPAAGLLEVSNASNSNTTGHLAATTYANAANFSVRRPEGTRHGGAPTAVQSGDILVATLPRAMGPLLQRDPRRHVRPGVGELDEHGTGHETPLQYDDDRHERTGDANDGRPSGNVGIGTTAPSAALDMVRESPGPLEINLTRFAGTSSSGEPNIVLRTARGTRAAPSAVQAGDELGGVFVTGYGATGFLDEGGAGFGAFVAENWTDTAQGTALVLAATPLGSNQAQVNLVVLPGGNVGIGQFDDFPTITDKLQVLGDIRVGTTGTNGCIKDFGGNALAGTCSSDRRFKKDITPFDHVLDRLTALQPVHYFWRASEFPDRQFGARRAYGLIAQDVEQVLPELVVTNEDGFKAVDYSELPLLTIQAVKDLKSEVKELSTENDTLKQRLAELERLVAELLAAPRR